SVSSTRASSAESGCRCESATPSCRSAGSVYAGRQTTNVLPCARPRASLRTTAFQVPRPVDSELSTCTSVRSPVPWSTSTTRTDPSLRMSPGLQEAVTLRVSPGWRSNDCSSLYGVSQWLACGCGTAPAPAIGLATTLTHRVRDAPAVRLPTSQVTVP